MRAKQLFLQQSDLLLWSNFQIKAKQFATQRQTKDIMCKPLYIYTTKICKSSRNIRNYWRNRKGAFHFMCNYPCSFTYIPHTPTSVIQIEFSASFLVMTKEYIINLLSVHIILYSLLFAHCNPIQAAITKNPTNLLHLQNILLSLQCAVT